MAGKYIEPHKLGAAVTHGYSIQIQDKKDGKDIVHTELGEIPTQVCSSQIQDRVRV